MACSVKSKDYSTQGTLNPLECSHIILIYTIEQEITVVSSVANH